MHVLAVPLFLDATGVEIALTAWAHHRCLQLYLLLFSKLNRIFEGLNMLEKSETLHTPQKWRKFTSDMGFKSGCAKWLDSATYTLSTVCASSYVSRTCMKIRYTHVTHQYLPKSLLKQNPKPNRKLVIFN